MKVKWGITDYGARVDPTGTVKHHIAAAMIVKVEISQSYLLGLPDPMQKIHDTVQAAVEKALLTQGARVVELGVHQLAQEGER